MRTITLKTKRPCCGRASTFTAVVCIPRETYTRRCLPCETTWRVERTELRDSGGVRVDKLEWVDTKTRLYTLKYGTIPED